MTGPAIRTVYAAGQTAIGEVEDHGVGNIRAFTLTSIGRVAVGTFPDRRAAIQRSKTRVRTPALRGDR